MNIAGTPMGKVFHTPNIFQFVAIKTVNKKKKLFLLTFNNVTILTILISLKVSFCCNKNYIMKKEESSLPKTLRTISFH